MTKLFLSSDDKMILDNGFAAAFGGAPERYFSAPGRTEIGGNHTDHQRGRVLAGAVNLDTRAAVRVNGTDTIRIMSKGYPMSTVNVAELTPVEAEINSALYINYPSENITFRHTDLGAAKITFHAEELEGLRYPSVSLTLQNVTCTPQSIVCEGVTVCTKNA